MKWTALAVLVLTALTVGVFLGLNRPGAEASPDVTITVDSTGDTNTRDNFLTLREAIMLATGDLTLADLMFSECEQVSGTLWAGAIGCMSPDPPGATSADTIVFDTSVFPPASPATITLGSGGLPSLDTGGDSADGSTAGVIIDGVTAAFGCFGIGSANNSIKGLEIYHCSPGIGIYTGTGNTIGGSSPGERNVISGHTLAVGIYNSGTMLNTVKGNYIGTDATGTTPMPNEYGVQVLTGAQNNTVGGIGSGDGNLIAFNSGDGVLVNGAATTGNAIRRNSIHSNGGKGIENESGGNEELAPPVITGFGSVMGTACPNCTIDLFSDDEDEGRVYEGSFKADGDGNWSTLPGIPEGPNVTATATDSDGNTSEFSAPVAVPEPTPTATATPPPSPTPPVGPTRTLHWGPGWHNDTWTGASTPEEVFACAAGDYAAAYRFTDTGLERYFPDRPDISDMTPLAQYDAFLILTTDDVTCEMTMVDPPGTERMLEWGGGWQNDSWTGPDGTAPEDAFACADGSYAAAYRFTDTGLERYFPDRPDISDMGPLAQYDAFLILVTAPVSCTMPIAP